MKLDLNKSKHVSMLNNIRQRAEITERLAKESKLKELQNKNRNRQRYRRDPICINGYMVRPKKGSVDSKNDLMMKDQIFYM